MGNSSVSFSFKVCFALILSAILLLPNFIPNHLVKVYPASSRADWDKFDPTLVPRLRSVDDVLRVADSEIFALHKQHDTLLYADIVGNLLRNRFYHGYCYYSLQENYLAALAGALVYRNLDAIVLPDDILKYPMAACSQMSIIRAECFNKRGIDYREVSFKGHFALEGKIAGQWRYYDSNLEPDFSVIPRKDIQYLIDNNELGVIYSGHKNPDELNEELTFMGYGDLNQNFAPRAKIFHRVTKFLSKTLWLIPLFWCGVILFGKKRSRVPHD